ncbi:hypothetical protein [Gymnodinialimonas ceratoperidinii]|uniref:Uncharacterized protein n=1 Tax=Gymnodinialimonas ceratoperidinii TaxID=2856823 RepID=A0A8F6Y983_9RHOB|nr:hypothetical protein [Gymnodinialimonas ceratoperidinii]QXT38318.1 hypothetical protein KYE46_10175 [Gymnodinialimonas ceratoperidinii]
MTTYSNARNVLGVLLIAGGTVMGTSAVNAQTTLSASECRSILQMDRSLVRPRIFQACQGLMNRIGEGDGDNRQQITRSRTGGGNPGNPGSPGGSDGGNSASGTLTVTASALRNGRLGADACIDLTNGATQSCSLVQVSAATGTRQMLLGHDGTILNANVDVGGHDLLDATVAGSDSGLSVDADLAGHDLADVTVGSGDSGGLGVDADLGGHSLAEVEVGGDSGLSLEVVGINILN